MRDSVTGSELAGLFGVSRARIGQLERLGHVHRGARGYDLGASIKGYVAFIRQGAGGLGTERQRLVRLKADLASLTLQERTGTLVSREAMLKKTRELAQTVRDNFLNLPSRTDAAVACEPDRQRCFDILTKEVRQILETLSQTMLDPSTPASRD